MAGEQKTGQLEITDEMIFHAMGLEHGANFKKSIARFGIDKAIDLLNSADYHALVMLIQNRAKAYETATAVSTCLKINQ